MNGIPRILQTRADFDFALNSAIAGEVDKHLVISIFVGLIESSKKYVFDRALTADELPDGDSPIYYVIEPTDTDLVRRQIKLVADKSSRLLALGYSISEVNAIIKELEGV